MQEDGARVSTRPPHSRRHCLGTLIEPSESLRQAKRSSHLHHITPGPELVDRNTLKTTALGARRRTKIAMFFAGVVAPAGALKGKLRELYNFSAGKVARDADQHLSDISVNLKSVFSELGRDNDRFGNRRGKIVKYSERHLQKSLSRPENSGVGFCSERIFPVDEFEP